MPGAFPSSPRSGTVHGSFAHAHASADLAIADDDNARASSAFELCIQRLEEAVTQETAALKGGGVADLRDFNNRKSQGLLELSRSLRSFQGAQPSNAALARLSSLREKLDTNRAVLKLHMEAVREVATVMSDAIRDAESDGTYSPSVRAVLKNYD